MIIASKIHRLSSQISFFLNYYNSIVISMVNLNKNFYFNFSMKKLPCRMSSYLLILEKKSGMLRGTKKVKLSN